MSENGTSVEDSKKVETYPLFKGWENTKTLAERDRTESRRRCVFVEARTGGGTWGYEREKGNFNLRNSAKGKGFLEVSPNEVSHKP
jgi:hypothetical protein